MVPLHPDAARRHLVDQQLADRIEEEATTMAAASNLTVQHANGGRERGSPARGNRTGSGVHARKCGKPSIKVKPIGKYQSSIKVRGLVRVVGTPHSGSKLAIIHPNLHPEREGS